MCIFPAGCSMCPTVAWPQVHQHLAMTPLFSTQHTPWPNNRETWCTDLPYLAPSAALLAVCVAHMDTSSALESASTLVWNGVQTTATSQGQPYLFTAGCWAFQVYLHAWAVGVVSPGHSVCLLAWRRSIINILQFPKISTVLPLLNISLFLPALYFTLRPPGQWIWLSFKWNNPHGNEWF